MAQHNVLRIEYVLPNEIAVTLNVAVDDPRWKYAGDDPTHSGGVCTDAAWNQYAWAGDNASIVRWNQRAEIYERFDVPGARDAIARNMQYCEI